MKHIQIYSQAPSTRPGSPANSFAGVVRTTLPDHEHAARQARAKTLGLPRKSKPTSAPSTSNSSRASLDPNS